jgi:signal transduction histidine kinase
MGTSIGKKLSDPKRPSVRKKQQVFGTGEMADLTRAFDWKSTSAGAIDDWPETLLITVNNLLATKHPMFLWWGPDLIQFYNDAYRQTIRQDKHPRALGQMGRDCWPEIWPVIWPQIEQVMTTGEATWNENQLVPITRNGKLEDVYWTYSYSPVRDFDGSILGTLVTCTETTSTTLAQISLRQQLDALAELFAQAPAFFAVLRGPDHTYQMTNPLYQKLIGQRHVIGKSIREALPEVREQGFIDLLSKVYESGEPYVGRNMAVKLAYRESDVLEERILDFIYQPLRDSQGTISGIIVFGIDVTDAKRAELTLIQSEKLAAVGRLASSIAHEINNPLEAVTNLVYLAQVSSPEGQAKKYLQSAEIELRRVSAIASQTLRFHKQSTSPVLATCDSLIGGPLSLYQGRLRNSNIQVIQRMRAKRPVECFEGEIRQAIANLIANAIDAMHPQGGTLLLRSRKGIDWRTNRPGLVITIADTGAGISRQTMSRLFEPFFTTKGYGGTGLGLWITHGIVTRNQGRILLRSKPGRGTVVSIFLPFRPAQQ